MAIRMKTTVTMRPTATAVSHSRTDVAVRDTSIIIDEPLERDGTNLGPSPTETAIASLIACTNTIGHKCADKLGIDLGAVTFAAQVSFDRRGVTLAEEIDVPFPDITLTVTARSDASAEDLIRVGQETAKYCPIAKVFQAAGTDLTVLWEKG
ncbi:OsmC family protein [Jannaschia sp. 2305UL9-9]|uniref:OsmC family protein n=1 Tax=Jannaschia sp. 2305UL9-9 TaxID=3121638 RepID=UPI00352883FC